MSNSPRVTIQDIAQSLGVPVAQVTKVILGQPGVSDDSRHQVMSALVRAGLVRISRGTTSGLIGIVVPNVLMGDYIGDVVRGITETAKSRGYSVALNIETTAKSADLLQMVEPGGCDGVIGIVPNSYRDFLDLCRRYERPHVLIDHQANDELTDAFSVEVNNYQSMINVLRYLLGLGHRRIGFITGNLLVASARHRLEAYRDTLEAAGVPVDLALIVEGDWQIQSGYMATQALLALNPHPTAIVASNDLMAFGALRAARERGLNIGSDISITGFDDIEMAASVTPPLTTVRQPTARIGETAVDLLDKHLRGEKIAERRVQLDTELIVRQSTGVLHR
jgi:DNA-binding LacI/PurR family transcriptional regulator